MNSSFPIIIMTRNEGRYLEKCVYSILSSVSIPTHIYIIDNSSDDKEHIQVLNEIQDRMLTNVNIIRNENNLWVLGLNKTLASIKGKHKSKYFFLTDGDINFEACNAKPCWLSYLIQQMEANICIGKIGLSLDWKYLSEHISLSRILDQEKSLYSEDKKINDMYISFVDTTASIFRWDWSIEESALFYPDHMRYLRPELYSCRTSRDILVEHLGWHLYHDKNSTPITSLNQKVVCFALVGGDVKTEILEKCDLKYKLFYKFFSKTIKRIWYVRRYFFLLKYTICKGFRFYDGQGVIKK